MNPSDHALIGSVRSLAANLLPAGSRVALYGSRARGDFREDSDWDLHVLIPGTSGITLEEDSKFGYPFFELGLKFGEIVNARVYTVADWVKRSFLPFYKNVEADKVILFKN